MSGARPAGGSVNRSHDTAAVAVRASRCGHQAVFHPRLWALRTRSAAARSRRRKSAWAASRGRRGLRTSADRLISTAARLHRHGERRARIRAPGSRAGPRAAPHVAPDVKAVGARRRVEELPACVALRGRGVPVQQILARRAVPQPLPPSRTCRSQTAPFASRGTRRWQRSAYPARMGAGIAVAARLQAAVPRPHIGSPSGGSSVAGSPTR